MGGGRCWCGGDTSALGVLRRRPARRAGAEEEEPRWRAGEGARRARGGAAPSARRPQTSREARQATQARPGGPGARRQSVLHVLGAVMVPGPHHQGGAASGVTVAEGALGRGWRGAGFLMRQEGLRGRGRGVDMGPGRAEPRPGVTRRTPDAAEEPQAAGAAGPRPWGGPGVPGLAPWGGPSQVGTGDSAGVISGGGGA